MKKNSLDLSQKIDKSIVELFEIIVGVVESLSVPFFVVGATARDIILSQGYGIQTGRATEDIDLGVQVQSWDDYNRIHGGLIKTGKFRPDNEKKQRLIYCERLPIDVIPFGALSDSDGCISWPPEHENEMSTLGFEEAYQASISVRLRASPILDIDTVSLPGLAVLKIISWKENRVRRKKDAKDLLLLMHSYLDAGNQDRLFEEESDLLEVENFDYLLAGSRLLGRDIAAILSPETGGTILKILESETGEKERYRLVENMTGIPLEITTTDFESGLDLLEELKKGLIEGLKKPSH